MPSPNPVSWFEIPVTDLERAKSFYETVFGTTLVNQEMGPMKMAWFHKDLESYGSTGALIAAEGRTPSHAGTLVYLSVEDIEAALQRVDGAGGKSLQPKTSIGEYGWVAMFEDSEGNRVALHQAP